MHLVFDTFEIIEKFKKPKEKVFAAFANADQKKKWYGHDISNEKSAKKFTSDFKEGGKGYNCFTVPANEYMPEMFIEMKSTHQKIIDNDTIIVTYEGYANGSLFSVSITNFQFSDEANGSSLKLTNQTTYLENADGPEMRKMGYTELMKNLQNLLNQDAA